MSPVATASRGDLLEHPDQAFDAILGADGVESVLCEEKHMGSRAVLLVCRSLPRRGSGSTWQRRGSGFGQQRCAGPLRPARSRRDLDQDRAPVLRPGLSTATLVEQVGAAASQSRALR